MYLKKVTIKNIKCFADLEIDFTQGKDIRLWTTLFGKNGLGKSTLLQAIGATLAGPAAVRELLPVAEGWVRQGEEYGEIEAQLLWSEGDALTYKMGRPKTKSPYMARYIVTGDDPEGLPESLNEHYYYTVPTLVPWSGEGGATQRGNATKDLKRLQQTAYAEKKSGWLGCGYGPFRRLSGGGQEADRILYAERISARFVTLFREDAALTSATEWLIRLHNTAREGDQKSQRALEQVKDAFGFALFPERTELKVSARAALLQVGKQKPIPLHDLSDGYRSMLALSIDLLRWLIKAFPDEDNPMSCPGVVLIDELDVHLHPAWQRRIGHWLREKFPKIQFIIATHSPFLAQVADDQTPIEHHLGGNIVLQQTSNGVVAHPELEPMQDLRADQILMSPLFDMESLLSPKTERKLARHDALRKMPAALSGSEEQEYEQLTLWRERLPIQTNSTQRRLERSLQKAIQQHSDRLQELS